MIDYKKLLIKYINHVGFSEGVVFLSEKDSQFFTKEEFEELKRLAQLEGV